MKIEFFGHAAFGLTGAAGFKVLLDPYEPGAFRGALNYKPIPGKWDVVIVSHEHLDHNHVSPSFGAPAVVKGPATHRGMEVRTFDVKHGDAGGTVDFGSRISVFSLDGLRFAHPGDMGKPVSSELAANLSGIDILFVPVGGHFTMGPKEAREFIAQVNPKIAIPMHYKTRLVTFPIRPVDDFVKEMGAAPLRKLASGSVDVDRGSLPTRTEVWLMPMLCA